MAAEWGYKLGKFVKTDYPDFRQEIYSKILPAIQKKTGGGAAPA